MSPRYLGFALPAVLIASIVMLDVLLIAVTSTAAVRISLSNQSYEKLSQMSGEAGTTYAQACLDVNFGVAEWTDSKPLRPDTDCYGNQLASCPEIPTDADCHYVINTDRQESSFSVGMSDLPLVMGWKSISSSESNSCGIALDDKVYCWGSNSSGNLGDGTTKNSRIPVAVDTTGVLQGKTILKVSTGGYHTCAIASDNKAYCWGSNSSGQLGNFSNQDSHVPVAVDATEELSGKSIIDISAGFYHTCAVTSENLAYCWGMGEDGQLGHDSYSNSSVPVAVDTDVELSGRTVTKIEAFDFHSCAIADNLMFCWGEGDGGQLGDGDADDSDVPVAVAAGVGDELNGRTVTAMAGSENHTCAIADNLSFCWGINDYGELGDDSYFDSDVPVAVDTSGALNGKTIISISAYYQNTCVVASDNKPYCWGKNQYGQLGDGQEYSDSNEPVAVDASGVLSGKNLVQVSSGWRYSCGLDSDYQAYCWGFNSVSQLGDNSIANRSEPVRVNVTGVLVKNIESIGKLGIKSIGGDLWKNVNKSVRLNMLELVELNRLTAIKTSLGVYFTCSMASDNNAYCWGINIRGQLGDNTAVSRSYPTAVYRDGALSGKTVLDMSTGGGHACVVASDNRAYCWGDNYWGQVGNDTNYENKFAPTSVYTGGVLSGVDLEKIDNGEDTTCAISVAGKAYCWGRNNYGQLGNGSWSSPSPLPDDVVDSGALLNKSVTDISAGGYHTCAIADEAVYCWGSDSYGKLGNGGTNVDTNAPTAVDTTGVLSGKEITQVASSLYHTCVIGTDVSGSRAYCWGRNNFYQLGDGTNVSRNTPVAVIGTAINGKDIISIDVGLEHTCLVTDENKVYCWGGNFYGQIGNDSTSDQDVPVAVNTNGALNEKEVISVSVSSNHSCAIISDGRQYCWGSNFRGELGNGSSNDSLVPVAVELSYLNYLPINF